MFFLPWVQHQLFFSFLDVTHLRQHLDPSIPRPDLPKCAETLLGTQYGPPDSYIPSLDAGQAIHFPPRMQLFFKSGRKNTGWSGGPKMYSGTKKIKGCKKVTSPQKIFTRGVLRESKRNFSDKKTFPPTSPHTFFDRMPRKFKKRCGPNLCFSFQVSSTFHVKNVSPEKKVW